MKNRTIIQILWATINLVVFVLCIFCIMLIIEYLSLIFKIGLLISFCGFSIYIVYYYRYNQKKVCYIMVQVSALLAVILSILTWLIPGAP